MTKILEYITLNYTWFLGGAILILLAIIGYYADKTNFGQAKSKKDEDDNENKIDESLNLVDSFQTETDNQMLEEQPIQEEVLTSDNVNSEPQNKNINNSEEVVVEKTKPKITKKKKMKQTDAKKLEEIRRSLMEQKSEIKVELSKVDSKPDVFSAFDDEFNSLVPKKDILEDDLLSDIQDIKIDKPQKKKKEIKDVPDLDNVELPKIKKMESSKKNIWEK